MARFLIVRLGALGDIVHAIPVAAALRRACPTARIDWMVSGKHREILDLVPAIDERLSIKDRSGTDEGESLWGALQRIRKARYDVTIDLQGLLKSAVIARLSGAEKVVGFNGRYSRESMARAFYTDVYDPGGDGMYAPSETRHVVDINLGMLKALGIDPGRPEFPLADIHSAVAASMAEATAGSYVLLNPGAAWPNKRWPAARFGEVASFVREVRGLQPYVLWGPAEETLARDVVAASGQAARMAPATTMADLLELSRRAALMVSGDTGPLHIAGAAGTPLVAIFGPTDPARNGPWASDDIVVSRYGSCGCHYQRQCRQASWCLEDITVAEVTAAIQHRLGPSHAPC